MQSPSRFPSSLFIIQKKGNVIPVYISLFLSCQESNKERGKTRDFLFSVWQKGLQKSWEACNPRAVFYDERNREEKKNFQNLRHFFFNFFS